MHLRFWKIAPFKSNFWKKLRKDTLDSISILSVETESEGAGRREKSRIETLELTSDDQTGQIKSEMKVLDSKSVFDLKPLY